MPGRIFFVGAGASRADSEELPVPLPLAREFFTTPYINAHWSRGIWGRGAPFEESALARILQHYFGCSWSKSAGKLTLDCLINVEEVYSFIEICLQVYPAKFLFEREVFEQGRRDLLRYIVNVIRYVPWRLDRPKLHSTIVRNLKPEDSIITFNWDLLFDQVLNRTKKGRVLLERQADLLNPFRAITTNQDRYEDVASADLHKGRFLKLHGSINLAICEKPDCALAAVPYRFGLEDEMLEGWPCRACGSPLEVMIIPPYVHKSYLSSRFSRVQASIAVNKISMAEEITIIGYSMPVFDFHARTLMRLARMSLEERGLGELLDLERLVIVNPQISDAAYRDQATELFGINHAADVYGTRVELVLYSTIDEYIAKELSPKSGKRRTASKKPARSRPK
jgi:NAD-dependent SIR2 family protein deacetylase